MIAASSRMLFGGHTGAAVTLTLSPADAQVSLDDSQVEGAGSPRVVEGVAPGEHELSIAKHGFVTQHHKLTIDPNMQPQRLTFALTPGAHSAAVTVSSDPPGAQLFINGRASSQVTPATLTGLGPGVQELGLKLTGYADAKEALNVPGDALVSIQLAPLSEADFAQDHDDGTLTRAQQRAQTRERRAAERAAKQLQGQHTRTGR